MSLVAKIGGGSVGQQKTAVASAAATAALVTALAAPPAGYRTVIDSITASYNGTVQTSETVLLQEVVGPVTVWHTDLAGPVAGLGNGHWAFASGLNGQIGKQLQVQMPAMANCALKVAVTYHEEIGG